MEGQDNRKETGTYRRRLIRECFEGDVTPETHHAFARPDIHRVLADFGYWLSDFDGDSSTYVRRGGQDFIDTHRPSGTWRHVVPQEKPVEGEGSESLRDHLAHWDEKRNGQ